MKNLLSSTAFLVVNKELAKQIGLHEVVLLADLISKEQYFIDNKQLNEGYFFNTAKNIQDDTTLTAHQQRKAIKNLELFNIIKTKLIGIPAKKHFKILENNLLTFFNTSCKNNIKQDVKKAQTINKNKEITIKNNISIREKFISEVMDLDYPKEIKIDFIEYWCEGKNKMRWQKQPTFDISLRLKRWQRNQKKWNKGQSKIDSQINEYIKGKELL
tara:strand:- start:1806 stop:2450 length:645 start_codon:yes stop_codon:yes gene_type:complete